MTFSRNGQKKLYRGAIATFLSAVIVICGLVVVSTLTGCTSKYPEPPTSPRIATGDSTAAIIAQYGLENGRHAFLVEVDLQTNGEHGFADTQNGKLMAKYQRDFLRALHEQIARALDKYEQSCTIESIAITAARVVTWGHYSYALPSGAYVIIKCQETADAGTPE